MPSPADPQLTVDEAADALGTGPDFIAQLLAAGHLDHIGHGDDLRIPESALIAYAITVSDSPGEAETLAAQELSATAQITDSHVFGGQEVAA